MQSAADARMQGCIFLRMRQLENAENTALLPAVTTVWHFWPIAAAAQSS
jgi:hypothetical protein